MFCVCARAKPFNSGDLIDRGNLLDKNWPETSFQAPAPERVASPRTLQDTGLVGNFSELHQANLIRKCSQPLIKVCPAFYNLKHFQKRFYFGQNKLGLKFFGWKKNVVRKKTKQFLIEKMGQKFLAEKKFGSKKNLGSFRYSRSEPKLNMDTLTILASKVLELFNVAHFFFIWILLARETILLWKDLA